MSIVEPPSYEQLALFVVELTGRLDEAATRLDEAAVRLDEANARIAALEAEVAALRARVGQDSTNSSTPPSADPPGAKAKRKAVTSQRVRSKGRKRGGQPGRPGSGLVPTQDPDDTRQVEAAAECSGCGADLVEHGDDARATWAQVWDIKPIELEKVHYVLPKRRCGCCGKLTTARAPYASAGSVAYAGRTRTLHPRPARTHPRNGNCPSEAAEPGTPSRDDPYPNQAPQWVPGIDATTLRAEPPGNRVHCRDRTAHIHRFTYVRLADISSDINRDTQPRPPATTESYYCFP